MINSIHFFTEEIDFEFKNQSSLKNWIKESVKEEGKTIDNINYIACSDEYLYQLNVKYLNHDTYTDIITFDYTSDDFINGDIYISIDRVEENANKENTSFENELHRVIIHGAMHMCGYKDKTKEEANEMRNKENEKLEKFRF